MPGQRISKAVQPACDRQLLRRTRSGRWARTARRRRPPPCLVGLTCALRWLGPRITMGCARCARLARPVA